MAGAAVTDRSSRPAFYGDGANAVVVDLALPGGNNVVINPNQVSAITVWKVAKWGGGWRCSMYLAGLDLHWPCKTEREARNQQNVLIVKLRWQTREY